jgi:hypothetical protein
MANQFIATANLLETADSLQSSTTPTRHKPPKSSSDAHMSLLIGKRQKHTSKPRDSLQNRYRLGSPGSRRYQRILNEFLLWRMSRDMARYEAEMSGTDTETENDFEFDDPEVYEPKYTRFSFLFLDIENMKRMEPFLDITIEEQEKFFRSIAKRKRRHDKKKRKYKCEHASDTEQKTLETLSQENKCEEEVAVISPKESFRRLSKRTRKLLQRNVDSNFLEVVDEELYRLFKGYEAKKLPKSSNSSGVVAFETKPNTAEGYFYKTFYIEDSYHRCLVHGVSQYYCLKSYSYDSPNGRITVVQRGSKCRLDPELSLTCYLRSRHHEPQTVPV